MNPELVNRSRANSLERMAHASLKDKKQKPRRSITNERIL
jgi:hypothetical protein